MTLAQSIKLRGALPSDRAFLLALYTSLRADEFAQLGWPVDTERAFVKTQFDAQRGDFERRHPGASCQIIELRRCPIGRLWVAEDARSLTVLDISVIADLRGHGIGGECLHRVQRCAAAARLDVELQVALGNPAQGLFERAGFRPVGEAGMRQAMVWKPEAHPSAGHTTRRRRELDHERA